MSDFHCYMIFSLMETIVGVFKRRLVMFASRIIARIYDQSNAKYLLVLNTVSSSNWDEKETQGFHCFNWKLYTCNWVSLIYSVNRKKIYSLSTLKH